MKPTLHVPNGPTDACHKQEPSVMVMVVLPYQGQYLLEINNPHLPPGKLFLPGGAVETTDENHVAALQREMKEEFGLLVPAEELVLLGQVTEGFNAGSSIFQWEKHPLTPGVYHSENIELVVSSVTNPDYMGPSMLSSGHRRSKRYAHSPELALIHEIASNALAKDVQDSLAAELLKTAWVEHTDDPDNRYTRIIEEVEGLSEMWHVLNEPRLSEAEYRLEKFIEEQWAPLFALHSVGSSIINWVIVQQQLLLLSRALHLVKLNDSALIDDWASINQQMLEFQTRLDNLEEFVRNQLGRTSWPGYVADKFRPYWTHRS